MKLNVEIATGLLHSALTESPDYAELESGEVSENDLISLQMTAAQVRALIEFIYEIGPR